VLKKLPDKKIKKVVTFLQIGLYIKTGLQYKPLKGA
jgi:hypothetical protein